MPKPRREGEGGRGSEKDQSKSFLMKNQKVQNPYRSCMRQRGFCDT